MKHTIKKKGADKASRLYVALLYIALFLATITLILPVAAAPTNTDIIGIEWDSSKSSTAALTWIDSSGSPIAAPNFDDHIIWGNMRRVTLSYEGDVVKVTGGTNNRGDGLILDGSTGNVMVEIPKFFYKSEVDGNYHRWWISPTTATGFELFPAFVQRGGATRDHLYIGAFEASGYLDGSTFKLQSATGKQPVTGAASYTNLPNSGQFNINDAETYANNIGDGDGWGNINIYSYSAVRLLYLIEYADWDSQTTIGKGIVDKIVGSGFAGENTGIDSINTNINTMGTGTGTGTDGLTPIAYRGIENPWGNTWTFISGYSSTNDEYRIIKEDGTGDLSTHPLASGSYTASSATPLRGGGTYVYGYWKSLESESLLQPLMIPSSVSGGSESTYGADYFYSHNPPSTPTILLAGGSWSYGRSAGVGFLHSRYAVSSSVRSVGARLEFIGETKEEGVTAGFTANSTVIDRGTDLILTRAMTGDVYQYTFSRQENGTSGYTTFATVTNSTPDPIANTGVTTHDISGWDPGTYDIRMYVQGIDALTNDTLIRYSYLDIGDKPVSAFSADKTVADLADTITFTDGSTNTPSSWQWDYQINGTPGWVGFNTAQNPGYTFSATGTYDIRLNASNAYGYSIETKPEYIEIGNKPVSSYDYSQTPATLNVSFTDTSTNTPTSWSWNFGDGNTSSVQNPSHTYVAEGAYTVTLTATNAYGADSTSDTANAFNVPTAGFTASPVTGIAGTTTIRVTDSSTNAITWLYDFGDGTTSTSQNPSHIYAAAGTYTITQTVYNTGGNDTLTRTDYIKIGTLPTAIIIADPTTTTKFPATVSFNGSTSLPGTGPDATISSYAWQFGDSNTGTGANTAYIYPTTGRFTAKLTVTNPYGSHSTTELIDIGGIGYRPKVGAADKIAYEDTSSFAALMGLVGEDRMETTVGESNIDLEGVPDLVIASLIASMGPYTMLIIISIPIIGIAIMQGKTLIPGTIGILLMFWARSYLPASTHNVIYLMIGLYLVAVLWGIYKERF